MPPEPKFGLSYFPGCSHPRHKALRVKGQRRSLVTVPLRRGKDKPGLGSAISTSKSRGAGAGNSLPAAEAGEMSRCWSRCLGGENRQELFPTRSPAQLSRT